MQQDADPSTGPKQPRRYSCPAFLVRKATRVVRAVRESVCFVEQHTGRNKVLLRHLTT
jgi:hypothetical protein